MRKLLSILLTLFLISSIGNMPVQIGVIASQGGNAELITENLLARYEYDNSGGRHYVGVLGSTSISTAVTDPYGATNGIGVCTSTGDYLTIADSDDWPNGTDSWTIGTWINWQGTTRQGICGQHSGSDYFYIEYDSGGMYFRVEGSANITLYYSWSFNTSQWYWFQVIRDGSNFYMYIDGTQVASTTSSASIPNMTNEWRVGHDCCYEFAGYLSDFYVSSAVESTTVPTAPIETTDDMVLHIPMTGSSSSTLFVDYASPADSTYVCSWVDLSGNYNHLKQATLTYRPSMHPTNGITFDGSDDYMSNLSISQSQPFTAYVVANVTSTGSSDYFFGEAGCGMLYDSSSYFVVYAGVLLNSSLIFSSSEQIYCGVFNQSSSVAEVFGYTPTQGQSGTDGLSNLYLGGTGVAFTAVKYKAVLLYSGAHNSDQRESVFNYLNSKY